MQDETVKKSKEHQSLFRKLDKETQTLKSARGDVQQGPGLRKSRRRLADALFLDGESQRTRPRSERLIFDLEKFLGPSKLWLRAGMRGAGRQGCAAV